MPNKPKSTHCRYCGQPGDLVRGAHPKCFNSKPCFDPNIPGAREAYNRTKRIQKLMRVNKMTRAEAEQHLDSKLPTCVCGAEKPTNAKYCAACAKERAKQRSAIYMAENREKIRRADVIRHRIKNGMSREEAEAIEDAKGICTCGRPARFPNGRICKECYQARDRDAHRGVVRLVAKMCCQCGMSFQGTSNAKYCDLHKNGGKRRPVKKVVIPSNWEEKKPVVVEKPVVVVVPANVKVRRYDQFGNEVTGMEYFGVGLRDVFNGRLAVE